MVGHGQVEMQRGFGNLLDSNATAASFQETYSARRRIRVGALGGFSDVWNETAPVRLEASANVGMLVVDPSGGPGDPGALSADQDLAKSD